MPTAYDEAAVAVVMVSDKEELFLLAEKKKIWDKFKTVLVLPNDESKTISLGHSLSPRFVTYMDSDFSDVEAVLGKMLKDKFKNNNNE